MMKKYDKSALIRISQVFVEGGSETALSSNWLNQIFDSL